MENNLVALDKLFKSNYLDYPHYVYYKLQRRKLVICMALLGDPKILLCDEIFAALDVLTIHMLKEILVNLQKEKPKMCIVITEHQARELLSIVDRAMILSNCKIIAEGSPNKLIKDEKAKTQYFGDFF